MFDVWNDASLSRLIGRFTDIDGALAAMRRNSVLALPQDWVQSLPFRIEVAAAGLLATGGRVDLILGAGVEVMTLSGPATFHVRTEGTATRVTAIAAATATRSAGICDTSPSPIVNKV